MCIGNKRKQMCNDPNSSALLHMHNETNILCSYCRQINEPNARASLSTGRLGLAFTGNSLGQLGTVAME